MAEQARNPMDVEEFLEWQARQTQLCELVDGYPAARWEMMSGASNIHDAIVVDIIVSL